MVTWKEPSYTRPRPSLNKPPGQSSTLSCPHSAGGMLMPRDILVAFCSGWQNIHLLESLKNCATVPFPLTFVSTWTSTEQKTNFCEGYCIWGFSVVAAGVSLTKAETGSSWEVLSPQAPNTCGSGLVGWPRWPET